MSKAIQAQETVTSIQWMGGRKSNKPDAKIIAEHGYIAHAVDRRKEADNKQRDPKKKVRRWLVEVCHSWFNRLRKRLVLYEKRERRFLALNHLATAIIDFLTGC